MAPSHHPHHPHHAHHPHSHHHLAAHLSQSQVGLHHAAAAAVAAEHHPSTSAMYLNSQALVSLPSPGSHGDSVIFFTSVPSGASPPPSHQPPANDATSTAATKLSQRLPTAAQHSLVNNRNSGSARLLLDSIPMIRNKFKRHFICASFPSFIYGPFNNFV